MPRPDVTALSANWKALFVSPNKTVAHELSSLLQQHAPRMAVFEMQSYPKREALGELSGPGGPNLCFLDLITDPERGLDLVAELLQARPELKITVLIGSKNPDLILRAMRQGAAEFLVRPFDSAQLDHAIERIAAIAGDDPAAAAPRGRVVCVFPAKGACGASTVSSALAQSAKRAGFQKILLADLDPLTGMLSFLLKLKGNYSFLDVLTRTQTLDADLWKGLVVAGGGMDVLLAPENTPEAVHELHDASPILDYARSNYEVVIADCGGAYGAWHLSLARRADDVLLLTTNELPALQAAQRAIAYLEANEVPRSRIRLVVNRYSKEFGLSREVIETGLHCDIFHLLPSDYESINRALLDGKPVGSGTNFGKSLAQLADRLYGRPNAPAGPGAKKGSALSSILTLFGRK
jgi:pilus assembly protein CpaE